MLLATAADLPRGANTNIISKVEPGMTTNITTEAEPEISTDDTTEQKVLAVYNTDIYRENPERALTIHSVISNCACNLVVLQCGDEAAED